MRTGRATIPSSLPWDNSDPMWQVGRGHSKDYDKGINREWLAVRRARLAWCSHCHRYDSIAGGCKLSLVAKENCEGYR